MSRFSRNSKSQTKPKSKTVKLFDIRRVEFTTKDGEKKTAAKVQFPKNVEIFVDGELVDLGEYNSMFLKPKQELVESLERALEEGKLSEEYVEKQIEYLEEKNISSVAEIYNK